MRILMINQWFQPEPMFKGIGFAKQLVNLGHEVEVLTGFPNYPEGRLYEGYRIRPVQRETIEGVPVVRVPLYPSHDSSSLNRVANFASFALSAATIGVLAARPADVVYAYHSPVTVSLPALVLRRLRRVPFVFDINDLWPDSLQATGMFNSPVGLAMVHKWCDHTYRWASRINVVSPGFKRKLIERGVPEEKIEVIYNWCEGEIVPEPRDEELARSLGMNDRFNVVFAGTMGKAQGLDAVLEAASVLSQRLPAAQFVLVGGGIEVDRLKAKSEEMNLANVRFVPRMERNEIGKVLALADVLLVHLVDDPLFRITIPSKTQAYLAVGRPIVMGVAGDAADLVRQAGAGVCCNPDDPESIAESICTMAAMPEAEREAMGLRGRKFYEDELSIGIGARRFERCFESAIAGMKS